MPWYRLPHSGCPYFAADAALGGLPAGSEPLEDVAAALADWELRCAQAELERETARMLVDRPVHKPETKSRRKP